MILEETREVQLYAYLYDGRYIKCTTTGNWKLIVTISDQPPVKTKLYLEVTYTTSELHPWKLTKSSKTKEVTVYVSEDRLKLYVTETIFNSCEETN